MRCFSLTKLIERVFFSCFRSRYFISFSPLEWQCVATSEHAAAAAIAQFKSAHARGDRWRLHPSRLLSPAADEIIREQIEFLSRQFTKLRCLDSVCFMTLFEWLKINRSKRGIQRIKIKYSTFFFNLIIHDSLFLFFFFLSEIYFNNEKKEYRFNPSNAVFVTDKYLFSLKSTRKLQRS